MVFLGGWEDPGTVSTEVTGMTADGDAMSQIIDQPGTSSNNTSLAWELASPSIGAIDLSWSGTNDSFRYISGRAYYFSDVGAAEASNGATYTGDTGSVGLTTLTNGAIVLMSANCATSRTFDATSPGTLVASDGGSGHTQGAAYYVKASAGAETYELEHSSGTAVRGSIIAVSMPVIAAGGGPVGTPFDSPVFRSPVIR